MCEISLKNCGKKLSSIYQYTLLYTHRKKQHLKSNEMSFTFSIIHKHTIFCSIKAF